MTHKIVEINNVVRTGEETQWIGKLYDVEEKDVQEVNDNDEMVTTKREVLTLIEHQHFAKKGSLQISYLQSYTEVYYGI